MPVKAPRELETQTQWSANEDFPALEEKIYKAIEMLKSAQAGRAAAERDAHRLRVQLEEREDELEGLRATVISLRKERDEVRARVEKMLKQIDSLAPED
jgi:hypothetical protein